MHLGCLVDWEMWRVLKAGLGGLEMIVVERNALIYALEMLVSVLLIRTCLMAC